MTSTQYIIPPTFNFSSYSGNTFSFWFKIPSKSITTDGACLVQFSNNTSYDLAEHLFIWNRPTNSISDYIYNSGRNYEFFLSNNSNNYSYMDNTWHHLAWVFGNTATHRLYIDGVLFGEITTVPYHLNANGTGSTLFHADWAGSAFNVIGNIDDVRMYNHVLTAAEISSLYGSGLPTPAKTPVLWYTFDDWTSGYRDSWRTTVTVSKFECFIKSIYANAIICFWRYKFLDMFLV